MTVSARGDAATTPVPAVHLVGLGPRIGSELTTVVAAVAVVAGAVGLAVEAASGFDGTAQRGSVTFPAWLMWAAALVLGAGALVVRVRRGAGYKGWSMIEMVERPDGLVLVSGRLGSRHEGVHVRPGETVTLTVTHQLRTSYRYDVEAPGGSLTLTADGFPQRLTMRPLEEAAARHGITVVPVGEATRIPRT